MKYPPLKAFAWTMLFVGMALWLLDFPPIGAFPLALVTAIVNAVYIEAIVTAERKKLAALKLQLDFVSRYGSEVLKPQID